jgi:hypothetical protein
MNKYLVTLNFGRNLLAENSRSSMRAAAARWGATFVEIIRSPVRGFLAQAHLDRLAPTPGRIAYFDRDMVIRDDCPSVFDLVPAGHFGFVLADQGSLSDEFRLNWNACPFDRWAKAIGSDSTYSNEKYFNGGLMIFDLPVHAPVFFRARKALGAHSHYVTWFDIQGCLSASANFGDFPTVRLPTTFNLISYQQPRPLHPEYMNAFVYHFDGCGTREKLAGASRSVWRREGWQKNAGGNDCSQSGPTRDGNKIHRCVRRQYAK